MRSVFSKSTDINGKLSRLGYHTKNFLAVIKGIGCRQGIRFYRSGDSARGQHHLRQAQRRPGFLIAVKIKSAIDQIRNRCINKCSKNPPLTREAGRAGPREKSLWSSGPSGSGKSTLLNKVQSKENSRKSGQDCYCYYPPAQKRRENGRDYRFLNKDEFLRRLRIKNLPNLKKCLENITPLKEALRRPTSGPRRALVRGCPRGREAYGGYFLKKRF